MRAPRFFAELRNSKRTRILAANGLLIAVIGLVDRQMRSNISLGYAYLFPMLVAGYYLSRWRVFLLAVLCAILRESFSPWAWQTDGVVRAVMSVFGYFGAALFVAELSKAWRVAEEQSLLRQDAEAQLRALIESSPAAIVNLDEQGRVLLANSAAQRVFGMGSEPLQGESIRDFLPLLAALPRAPGPLRLFRSTVECAGRRRNGEMFLAHVWFSTYQTLSGFRLAAIVSDGSEELRDREGFSLHSVMMTSQILIRAALHEIRNLGAAAAVAHANLARMPGVQRSEDFQALGTLVKGLEKIASTELLLSSDRPAGSADLRTVLDELRIVIEQPFQEEGISIHWDISRELPPVRADHQGLLQVFLNLAQNSRRAMDGAGRKEFSVTAGADGDSLLVRFQDTGRGIPVPDRLFQPLQPGAEATGLGLYISRAIVRSFSGELKYEPKPVGSCFAVQLALARAAVAVA